MLVQSHMLQNRILKVVFEKSDLIYLTHQTWLLRIIRANESLKHKKIKRRLKCQNRGVSIVCIYNEQFLIKH